MGGKPCIRGMRVTVGMVVEALSAGRTVEAAQLAQGHEVTLAI
jgi:uncharacterized protein (DUF433 family)